MKNNPYQYLYVPILWILFGLSACQQKNDAVEEKQSVSEKEVSPHFVSFSAEEYRISGIRIDVIRKMEISGQLKVNGFVDVPPENLISISSQMGGILRSTPLLQGSLVRKGQKIAVLENQDFVKLQQEYLEAESELELAESEYHRQKELYRQNVNSEKVLQRAKSQYLIMQSRTSGLSTQLRLLHIRAKDLRPETIASSIVLYAPEDGYVTKVNVNTGRFVEPNDIMFEIVNSKNLHIELKIFEKDLSGIRKGQKVRFLTSGNDVEQTARVSLLGREINQDKTVTLHCLPDRGSENLIPGAYLQAYIETHTGTVDAIPEDAILNFEGEYFVFVREKGATGQISNKQYLFRLVPVTVGKVSAGFQQISFPEHMEVNKLEVVVHGAYDLLSKMKNSEED